MLGHYCQQNAMFSLLVILILGYPLRLFSFIVLFGVIAGLEFLLSF